MAKGGVKIGTSDLDRVIRKFGKIPTMLKEEVADKIHAAGNEYANRAIDAAPRDESMLIQGISADRKKGLRTDVVSSAPHSAYMEFGTKRRAVIPPDLTAYAAQFKGKGGSEGGKGFYNSILAWVRRKGFASIKTKSGARSRSLDSRIAEEQAAYAIYLSIMRHGVKPHPYFFKHREEVMALLKKSIRPAINKIMRSK